MNSYNFTQDNKDRYQINITFHKVQIHLPIEPCLISAVIKKGKLIFKQFVIL